MDSAILRKPPTPAYHWSSPPPAPPHNGNPLEVQMAQLYPQTVSLLLIGPFSVGFFCVLSFQLAGAASATGAPPLVRDVCQGAGLGVAGLSGSPVGLTGTADGLQGFELVGGLLRQVLQHPGGLQHLQDVEALGSRAQDAVHQILEMRSKRRGEAVK